ncbi:hypothetical protein ACFVAJ_08690 [Agromyces sp. NPDC057679]|uniref:hypothetical protein n=1 Tax=Agromyces sp. NPDC057679 TaxID=3346207 RepID=UPI00366A6BB8
MTSMNDPETTARTEARRAGDEEAERLARDVEERERERDADPERAAGESSGGSVPGAPGNDEPMTDSTDGGLSGGDPGVEE